MDCVRMCWSGRFTVCMLGDAVLIYVFVYLFNSVCMSMLQHFSVCLSVCVWQYIVLVRHLNATVCECECVCVCVCVCVCACVHAHAETHTHTHTRKHVCMHKRFKRSWLLPYGTTVRLSSEICILSEMVGLHDGVCEYVSKLVYNNVSERPRLFWCATTWLAV